MYFRAFSSFLDDIANILPRWVLASDTKLTVSSTAFTYNACTKLKTTYGDKVRVLNSIRNMFIVFIYFLLTRIMATIGPINANTTPFSLGNQHLKQIYGMNRSSTIPI